MTLINSPPIARDSHGGWVRMHTLILLRWVAVAGQVTAIFVANQIYGFDLPLGLCYLAVGASVLVNVVSAFRFFDNPHLTERQAFLALLFDMVQHTALIYLTGGLTNPFGLLILAPVTISAAALELRTTLVLGCIAVALVTLTALTNLPLRYANGLLLVVPDVFLFGFWLSTVIGITFLGTYSRRVSTEIRAMSNALLATQMALAREQKLTDLGGVVAAAAHELGTPLATIKLVSAEMMEELSDKQDLFDDAKLIHDQASRCRDILRSMGKVGKNDKLMQRALLGVVLREAAEPHLNRGKIVNFEVHADPFGAPHEPTILRRPEIIHGLRNLIQNAVDFAESEVWIEGKWTNKTVSVRIVDNGSGYPSAVIGRIGDPFIRKRDTQQDLAHRPQYEGMGLGMFIAKTLLERSGARLQFHNASDPFLRKNERPERCGAVVDLVWPNEVILAPADPHLGENALIEI